MTMRIFVPVPLYLPLSENSYGHTPLPPDGFCLTS